MTFEKIGRAYLAHGDCFDAFQHVPENTVDLVFADPPYNIAIADTDGNKQAWDNQWADDAAYIEWMLQWMEAVLPCCKQNATLLFWHNDMAQIAELLHAMKKADKWLYVSHLTWHKPTSRTQAAANSKNRSFYNMCEYCFHFVRADNLGDKMTPPALQARYAVDGKAGEKIVEWLHSEMARLGITRADIKAKYLQEYPDASGAMLGHYLTTHQFTLPTRDVWQRVFAPLGFGRGHESLREEYESLRPYFDNSAGIKGNFYQFNTATGKSQLHPCEKPVDMLCDIICKTCPPDGVILDPFTGSGSTPAAAIKYGRNCYAVERDAGFHAIARQRLQHAARQGTLALDIAGFL